MELFAVKVEGKMTQDSIDLIRKIVDTMSQFDGLRSELADALHDRKVYLDRANSLRASLEDSERDRNLLVLYKNAIAIAVADRDRLTKEVAGLKRQIADLEKSVENYKGFVDDQSKTIAMVMRERDELKARLVGPLHASCPCDPKA